MMNRVLATAGICFFNGIAMGLYGIDAHWSYNFVIALFFVAAFSLGERYGDKS